MYLLQAFESLTRFDANELALFSKPDLSLEDLLDSGRIVQDFKVCNPLLKSL